MPRGPQRRSSQDVLNSIDDALHGEGHSLKSPHEKILSRAFPESDYEPPRRVGLMSNEQRIRHELGAAEVRNSQDPLRFEYGEPDAGRRWTGERYVRNIKPVKADIGRGDTFRSWRTDQNLYRRVNTAPPRQSYLLRPGRGQEPSPYGSRIPISTSTRALTEPVGATARAAGRRPYMPAPTAVRGPAGPYRRG